MLAQPGIEPAIPLLSQLFGTFRRSDLQTIDSILVLCVALLHLDVWLADEDP